MDLMHLGKLFLVGIIHLLIDQAPTNAGVAPNVGGGELMPNTSPRLLGVPSLLISRISCKSALALDVSFTVENDFL